MWRSSIFSIAGSEFFPVGPINCSKHTARWIGISDFSQSSYEYIAGAELTEVYTNIKEVPDIETKHFLYCLILVIACQNELVSFPTEMVLDCALKVVANNS
jgi:hypothetical protein